MQRIFLVKTHKKNQPWEHFLFDDFFSKRDYQVLKNFSREHMLRWDYKNATGFRDSIDHRVFLNEKFCEKNPQFKPVMKFLNNDKYFEKIFGVKLEGCSLRPELIDDVYPFYHEVHCDHPDKVLTMLIYIDKDDEQNLASDLYIDKNTHHTKLKWKDNSGVGWTIEPNDDKWHGFTPMEYKGVRRILICNWVKNNIWDDKSQLYLDFRTKPFRFQPKSWNKLNDLERNKKYDEYMEWLGGINHADGYTDNVNPMKPKQEKNLYRKLKAYILLCRRYRDGEIKITEQEMKIHLQDLQKLVDDNFKEILNNLMITKWVTSIFMCFLDLGTSQQKNFYKEIIKKLLLSKLDWTRGRTMITEDKLTNQNWFNKIKSEYKWKSINDINIT